VNTLFRKVKDAVTGEYSDTMGDAASDMQKVLDELTLLGGKPIETLDVSAARAQPTPTDAVMSLLRKEGKDMSPTALVPDVASVDRPIQGAVGELPARIYTPKGDGPFPVVVYFHGGGWVIADKTVYDGGARGLCSTSEAIVISVDYRRSPEAKFPAAWDDAFAAYQWAVINAASLNGDPTRMALAGESAGGNLAISTAIAARDGNVQKPLAVLAVYPVGQTGNLETESYRDSENARPLNKAMIGWFVDKLLADPTDKSNPRLDLINADLKGLPPVIIINAEIDPLRSDGEMLEIALKEAEVDVTRKLYSGVTHEFFGMAAVVSKAKDAQAYAGKELQSALGK